MAALGTRSNVAAPVRVFVRLRPPSERQTIEMFEISPERQGVVTIKDPLSSGRREHSFEFSSVFSEETSQEQLFMPVAGQAVDGALQGRSGCIIAYGQTGSGKTYSIFGEDDDPVERGLLPRAMERLLHGCAQKAAKDGSELDGITVSFLEVYMDQVRDLGFSAEAEDQAADASTPRRSSSGGLAKDDGGEPVTRRPRLKRFATQGTLADESGSHGLLLREAPDGAIHVQGLAQLKVRDLSDVSRIVHAGLARRATALTESNVRSSRSHTVFTVQLPFPSAEGGPTHLSFVDLAGSERLAKSKAEGQQFQEAMAINTSLTALGKVVLALASDPKTVRHVPYRDSKLTRILSASLRTQVSVLATIHPRVEDYEESLNTLSFADRCKNVARQPQVKYVTPSGTQKAKVADLQRQVAELKEKLRTVNAGKKADKPDDVDDAIAQVLAMAATPSLGGKRTESMATDVSAAGGGGADGTPSRRSADQNPQLNALMKLQERRKQMTQAIQASQEKLEALAKRKEQYQQKDPRDTEVIHLENRRNELQLELTKLQDGMDEFLKEKAKNFPEQLEQILKSSDLDDGNIIFKGHDAMVQGHTIAPRIANALEDGQHEIEKEGKEKLQALVKRQMMELNDAKDGLNATLKTKWERSLDLLEEYKDTQLAEEAKLKAAQDELDSLYSLVFRLVDLICKAEDGVYPVMRQQDGLRRVILPEGAKPPKPTPESHPKLFRALDKAERTEASLQRVAHRQLPAAARLRRLVAAATGLFDSLGLDDRTLEITKEETARSIQQGGPRSLGPALEGGLTQRKAVAQGMPGPTESPRDAGDRIGIGGSGSFDPEEMAERWLEGDSAWQMERELGKLASEQLQKLCLALRSRATQAFPISDVRASLWNEAEKSLQEEATHRHLQYLEDQRDEARAAYQDAVETTRRMRIDLELRRSGTLSSRSTTYGNSRPSSASRARSMSRPRTPSTGVPSRATSRPGTASRSRPPTATSVHRQHPHA